MVRLRPKGRTNDRPCNGRPRVTSQRQARHLSLIHLRNRMITNEDNARRASGLAIFRMLDKNFRRRLRESGLRSKRTVVGPIIKQRHKTARLAWARARRRWMIHTWQHIIFSDESRFLIRFRDGGYRVYRCRGKRFTDQCMYESDRLDGGNPFNLSRRLSTLGVLQLTGKEYKIVCNVNCKTPNVVYLLECHVCGSQYAGESVQPFNKKMNGHRSDHTKQTLLPMSQHFVSPGHSLDDFVRSKIYIIDHNPSWKENQRHKRESFWIRELQTLHPEGIHKKV